MQLKSCLAKELRPGDVIAVLSTSALRFSAHEILETHLIRHSHGGEFVRVIISERGSRTNDLQLGHADVPVIIIDMDESDREVLRALREGINQYWELKRSERA